MTGASRDPSQGPARGSARDEGGAAARIEGAVLRVYAVLLRLLPPGFRRAHGGEMLDLVRRRLRERRHVAAPPRALGHGIAELADLIRAAGSLRIRGLAARSRSWTPSMGVGGRGARLAAASMLAAVLVVMAPDIRIEGSGAVESPELTAAADSLDFRARDPAGEFTLSIRRGVVVAATIDGQSLPEGRIVQAGDSIRLFAPEGGLVVGVHFDPREGRIGWRARAGTDEVECEEPSGAMAGALGGGRS